MNGAFGRVMVLAVLVGTTGCATRMTFTEAIRNGNELDAPGMRGTKLADLQYFTSHRVRLRRTMRSGDGKIRRGRLLLRRGKKVEQVVVRRNTPGIVVDSGEGWVAVSFAKNTAMIFEKVGDAGTGEPGTYRLRQRHDDGRSYVDFTGETYQAMGASRWTTLQVRRRVKDSFAWRRRVLPGRRLK